MANYFIPGGGVEYGAAAQEEFLCRISNLYPGLVVGKAIGLYPLVDGFIVGDVTFFRDKDYRPCEPVKADVLTISAPYFKKRYASLRPHQIAEIYCRVRQLFELCENNGYDALVLCAFGCGAFNNPPEVVAEVFKYFLVDEGWAYKFKKVYFSIIEDHNSDGSNYSTFRNTLEPNNA